MRDALHGKANQIKYYEADMFFYLTSLQDY